MHAWYRSPSPRYLFGQLREATLISKLQETLAPTKTHGFEILSLVPHQKDGGVFVKFKYFETGDPQTALLDIEKDLREGVRKRGGVPSWMNISLGGLWLVKGKPWREVSPHISYGQHNFNGFECRISTGLPRHSSRYLSKVQMSRKNLYMIFYEWVLEPNEFHLLTWNDISHMGRSNIWHPHHLFPLDHFATRSYDLKDTTTRSSHVMQCTDIVLPKVAAKKRKSIPCSKRL